MLQNYIALDSPDSGARSSHIALKDELVGKLVFDDPRVFQRLGVDRVPAQFVADCAQTFKTNQNLLDAKRVLDKITSAAIDKPIEELEAEDEARDLLGIPKGKKTIEEKKMHKPLKIIFQHVETFKDSSGTLPKHSFESTDSTRSSSTTTIASGEKHVLWRQTGGFCEVKPTSSQGPKPVNPTIIKPLVYKTADYARLHLSARPFQLFSVGLLIFGSEFCVAIFDRDGILLSPILDMWKNIEEFVRIIRSLTCLLSPVELGQDPTVTTLPMQEHEIWRDKTKHLGRETPEDFPTFVITMGGPSGPSWYTIGLPIWTSVSLLGRGTSVWLVQENAEGPVLVLKNTWRMASRVSESAIYRSIQGDHPALAKLHHGADVFFPGEQRPITTRNLRSSTQCDDADGDVSLHRLLLKSRGRPLWEYQSEKELVQGIRAALSAHQFLCDQGVLHRDISAGNILLAAETPPKAGAEGILMDLEFARLKRSSLDTTRIVPVPPVRTPGGGMIAPTVRTHTVFGPDVIRGAVMTGTAQFMAVNVLESIVVGTPIEQEPIHDIESFIYALAYGVARKAVLDSESLDGDTFKRLHSFFNSTFGRMRLDDIYMSRRGQGPLTFYIRFPQLISPPMKKLLKDLDLSLLNLRAAALDETKPQPVTHASVLSILDEAIGKMV